MADEDDVVAAVMAELVAAFEMRRRADDDRGAALGNDMLDIDELVVALLGELVRQLDLVVGQDVDAEMRAFLEGRQALRVERAAPQHQRRAQRNPGGGGGRHAPPLAGAGPGPGGWAIRSRRAPRGTPVAGARALGR